MIYMATGIEIVSTERVGIAPGLALLSPRDLKALCRLREKCLNVSRNVLKNLQEGLKNLARRGS